MIAGVSGEMSSQARIRASSSAVLFVTALVPYAAGSGCTRESSGIVGIDIQFLVGWELLIAVIVTLATARVTVGSCGWPGGKVCCTGDGWNEPSMERMRGE